MLVESQSGFQKENFKLYKSTLQSLTELSSDPEQKSFSWKELINIYEAKKNVLKQPGLLWSPSMGSTGCTKCKLGGNQRQKLKIPHLHPSLHGVVNSRAVVVFTIFAPDLTVVCTFLYYICTVKIRCKSNCSCSVDFLMRASRWPFSQNKHFY